MGESYTRCSMGPSGMDSQVSRGASYTRMKRAFSQDIGQEALMAERQQAGAS